MSRQRTNSALPLGAIAAGFGLSLMGSAWAQTTEPAVTQQAPLPEVTVKGKVDRTPPPKIPIRPRPPPLARASRNCATFPSQSPSSLKS